MHTRGWWEDQQWLKFFSTEKWEGKRCISLLKSSAIPKINAKNQIFQKNFFFQFCLSLAIWLQFELNLLNKKNFWYHFTIILNLSLLADKGNSILMDILVELEQHSKFVKITVFCSRSNQNSRTSHIELLLLSLLTSRYISHSTILLTGIYIFIGQMLIVQNLQSNCHEIRVSLEFSYRETDIFSAIPWVK